MRRIQNHTDQSATTRMTAGKIRQYQAMLFSKLKFSPNTVGRRDLEATTI